MNQAFYYPGFLNKSMIVILVKLHIRNPIAENFKSSVN